MEISTVRELGGLFSEVLVDVISTTTGIYMDIGQTDDVSELNEMTGAMALTGEKQGMLFISASEADATVLCSFMTGMTTDEITNDDKEDVLCEIVNMTAGNTKLRLGDSEYKFTLSTPFLIKGQNVSIATKKRVQLISGTLSDGSDVTLRLTIMY